MGFMDCQVLRGSEYSVSDAPVASDHPQCSESFGGKQYRTFGCTMAGKELFDFTLYVHKIRLISSPLVAVCMYLHCVVFFFCSGDVDWFVRKPFVAFLFRKEERKRSSCGANTRSHLHSRCPCAAHHGWSYAYAVFRCYFRCCHPWCYIELFVLFR